jgi:uncharacterized protein YbjT (DUF2867 family)
MATLKVCILGGTGFVGRNLASKLVNSGHRVKVLTRQRERHRDMLVLPTLDLVQANVFDAPVLNQEVAGQDVVVNLVGILNEFRGRADFEKVHVALPTMVAEACVNQKVPRLLHMSALKASSGAPSNYLRTRGIGEDRVFQVGGRRTHITSFRPSVIFGRDDSFLNRFATLIRMAPGILPLAMPNARFQPVYVDDVTEAMARAMDNHHTYGKRYELCGPRVYTLRELVEYVARLGHRRCRVIGLNRLLSRLQAAVGELLPGKPISLDNLRSLQVDSVCTQGFPEIFGITPTDLDAVAPTWLAHNHRSHPRGH